MFFDVSYVYVDMTIKKFVVVFADFIQPDRHDELMRIEGMGGKVINWNGARVFGVLAMSRAIGYSHLYACHSSGILILENHYHFSSNKVSLKSILIKLSSL